MIQRHVGRRETEDVQSEEACTESILSKHQAATVYHMFHMMERKRSTQSECLFYIWEFCTSFYKINAKCQKIPYVSAFDLLLLQCALTSHISAIKGEMAL